MGALTSKLFLLSGSDLKITSAVTVKHPTVADVLSINRGFFCEELYWSYISAILSDPYDYMVYLDDKKIDYETVSAFQVFAMRWADMNAKKIAKSDESSNFMRDALTFYFGNHDFDIITVNNTPFLIDRRDSSWVMNDEIFDIATDFIFHINCLERTDKIKPGNAGFKRILIEDMRAEQKRKTRDKQSNNPVTHIGDALNAVLSGGSGAINPANYAETHIYQLLSASHAIQRKMVVQSMLNGIYTGMMKADKITNEELRWA